MIGSSVGTSTRTQQMGRFAANHFYCAVPNVLSCSVRDASQTEFTDFGEGDANVRAPDRPTTVWR